MLVARWRVRRQITESLHCTPHADRLTAAELDAVHRGVEHLLAPLRRADDEQAPEGAWPVRIQVFGFPYELEEP